MKKLLLSLIVVLVSLTGNTQIVRNYINIANSASINNPPYKYGWANGGYYVFGDEFNYPLTTFILQAAPSSTVPNYTDFINDYKILNPQDLGDAANPVGWHWFWSSHNWPGLPFYHRYENVVWDQADGAISLVANHENQVVPDEGMDPGYNPMYPMKMSYSAAMIKTFSSGGYHTNGQRWEEGWLYGYFEIRARLPQAKYTFPSYWLHGDHPDIGNHEEIDGLELGGNDQIIMSIHNSNDNTGFKSSTSSFSFAMPGQTFGGEWDCTSPLNPLKGTSLCALASPLGVRGSAGEYKK